MIYTMNEIKDRVAPVANKYQLRAVYLFGSYARSEAKENSDVDLLVDRTGSIIKGMFDMGSLYEDLKNSIGKNIDLITTQMLDQPETQNRSPIFVASVQKERIRIL
ncbi:MAG: nucleotidyltransferase domain-containing protein [Clostridia bacterium]|nr:nucleotidyltransferase domain-containing protein [Clostridia bacterium]